MLMKHIHRLSPWAAEFAGVNNWPARGQWVRGVMEGAGRDRPPPQLTGMAPPSTSGSGFRGERGAAERWGCDDSLARACAPRRRSATLVALDDRFTTFQEPNIRRACGVTLLERAGFRVELAGVCCVAGRCLQGLPHRRADPRPRRHREARPRRGAGVLVLGLEPSCIVALSDEWPELVPGPAAKRVAAAAEMADGWLARQISDGRIVTQHPGAGGQGLAAPALPPEARWSGRSWTTPHRADAARDWT